MVDHAAVPVPASTRLRQMLAGPDIVVLPGVYDGISARVALKEGFKALYMTGAGTSASRLGQPDLGLLQLNDVVENATMIAGLDPAIPVIADADTGFGGAAMCDRTCRAYIRAGVAAFHIEDQVQAKRCGALASKQLVSKEDFLVRIKAAVNARKAMHSDIIVIARSDCAEDLGFDEAIARCRAGIQLGADVAFIESIKTEEEARKVVEALAPAPVLLPIVGGKPAFTAKKAQEMGFKLVIYGCAGFLPAALALQKSYREILATGLDTESTKDLHVKDFYKIVGLDEIVAIDEGAGSAVYGNGF